MYPERPLVFGGLAPYVITITSGALPDGLDLDLVTGILSGTPTAQGGFDFSISAVDDLLATKTQNFHVNIAAADNVDACPDDPNKSSPGICGCGVADTDTDGDGTADCNDKCPSDKEKTDAGVCGCGFTEADLDADGKPDCGCTSVDVTQSSGDLAIGPEALRTFANNMLKKLIKNANRTNKSLGSRMQKSSKRSDKKMIEFTTKATQSLDQLPKVLLVCSDTTICKQVDNTDKIMTYNGAVVSLANQIIRTLNRATREISTSTKAAQKQTASIGKTVKQTRDALLAKSNSLPKVQSFCAG